jgi:hypothetical protein
MAGFFDQPSTEWRVPYSDFMKTNIYNPLTAAIGGNLFGTQGQPGAFTGADPSSWVAPISPLQQGAFDWAGQLPGMTNRYQQLGTQAAGAAAQPINFGALTNQAGNLWNRTIMPSIMERMAGMDAASSGGTADALGRAGESLTSDLFAQMVPLELQGRQQQLQAGNLYQQLAGMPLEPLKYMDVFGTQQREISQEAFPWNNPMMQYLLPMLGAGQQTAYQTAGGLGNQMLGVGLGAAGAGLAGAGIGSLTGMGPGAGALAALMGI